MRLWPDVSYYIVFTKVTVRTEQSKNNSDRRGMFNSLPLVAVMQVRPASNIRK